MDVIALWIGKTVMVSAGIGFTGYVIDRIFTKLLFRAGVARAFIDFYKMRNLKRQQEGRDA